MKIRTEMKKGKNMRIWTSEPHTRYGLRNIHNNTERNMYEREKYENMDFGTSYKTF